ncbi:MAG: methyltransferase domain-containing protein [Gemmatimonadota bacterium]
MSEHPTDATTDASGLIHLHGAVLDEAIAQRFTLADETVTVGSRQYLIRKPANADHLISEADYVLDERLPYWADLWPSARQLAATLLLEQGAGRSLLEMGCGLGLATLGALDAGFRVTATDYYEDALHVTRGNAARNLGVEPQVRMVNWRQWPDDLGTFDVVVAADVLYEKEYATLVVECMARALAPDGEAIVADPGRLALPAFFEALPATGLRVHDHQTVPYSDGAINQQIQIIRLRR